MIRPFLALLVRDLRLAVRSGGGFGLALVFFLILVAITPFAVGPDLALLARIGPAILWIGALLATMLGLERLLQADHEDGALDLLAMSPLPLELAVFAKIAAHWLVTGLPLTVAAPVLGLLLNVEPAALGTVALTLAIGTPGLTALGAVGAALTVTLRRGGLLVPVLVLPLAVPILIFGVAATAAAPLSEGGFGATLSILAGLSLGSVVLGPIAAAGALRVARG